jgi:phosphohistidine phosphatase
MQIFLMRHGIATEPGEGGYADEERPLTDEGRKRLKEAGRRLATLIEPPSHVLTSPLRRAHETAEITARELGFTRDLETTKLLKPNSNPEDLILSLAGFDANNTILIVSHQPFVSRLLGEILGAPHLSSDFKKGAVCRIDLVSPSSGRGSGTATLKWFASPGLLRG